jgi:hypothetical protein
MIARFSAEQLRKIADQLDAFSALSAAGADHLPPNTVIRVDGAALAYAHWWQDAQAWTAEVISFTPGDAEPLAYHDADQIASR